MSTKVGIDVWGFSENPKLQVFVHSIIHLTHPKLGLTIAQHCCLLLYNQAGSVMLKIQQLNDNIIMTAEEYAIPFIVHVASHPPLMTVITLTLVGQ